MSSRKSTRSQHPGSTIPSVSSLVLGSCEVDNDSVIVIGCGGSRKERGAGETAATKRGPRKAEKGCIIVLSGLLLMLLSVGIPYIATIGSAF